MTSVCATTILFTQYSNLYKTKQQSSHAVVELVPSCFLSVLHLLANLVTEDLIPVDLGACHWKLAA